MFSILSKYLLNYLQLIEILPYYCLVKVRTMGSYIYCGVMKFLADMPSCLGGEDNRINVA